MASKPRADGALPFERVQTSRVFEEVTAQIRQMIVSGQLTVGRRLPAERDLAVQFGVSRSSIREALRVLEIAGLVTLQKGGSGGAFICSRGGEVVETAFQDMFHLGAIQPVQLTDARLWIEAIVVRVAVERATEEDLAAMEANIEAAEQAYDDKAFERCAQITFEFHNLLARTTRNPLLIANVSAMILIMNQYSGIIGPPQSKYILKSRRRFMLLMRQRNAPLAVAEMEELLHRAHRHYLSKLEAVQSAALQAASA